MDVDDSNDPGLESFQIQGSHYGFSATPLTKLTAPQYTLATIVVDDSGSVKSFKADLENCVRQILLSFRFHPRSDYLMFRVVAFGSELREVIGFMQFADIKMQAFDNFLGQGGGTLLFGACKNAIDASNAYAKQLFDSQYKVNGLVYVITDGDDTCSDRIGITPTHVGDSLAHATTGESMESLASILVGVNIGVPSIRTYLDNFATAAKFNKFFSLDDASPEALNRIVEGGSQAIEYQSQAIGTGGPSQKIKTLVI